MTTMGDSFRNKVRRVFPENNSMKNMCIPKLYQLLVKSSRLWNPPISNVKDRKRRITFHNPIILLKAFHHRKNKNDVRKEKEEMQIRKRLKQNIPDH